MILIVDMNEEVLGFYEFVLPLCRIVEPVKYEVQHYTQGAEVEKYDKIILSGVPLKDFGYLKDMNLFEWIKVCDVPILGICAGYQVIGLGFDSLLVPCQEIGMTEIETVKKNPLFSSIFRAYELHNYGINPSNSLEILATSEKCVQAIKHKKKAIYGVLFHPEVRNKDVIKRFIHE